MWHVHGLVLALMCCVLCTVAAQKYQFEIFIYVGFTASRIFLFHHAHAAYLNHRSFSNVRITESIHVSLEKYNRLKRKDNITSIFFAKDPDSLEPGMAYLPLDSISHLTAILLLHAQSIIFNGTVGAVHVAATASVSADPTLSRKLDIIRETIELYGWKAGTIRTTKSLEEAMFGWLGANYMSKSMKVTEPYIDIGSLNLNMAIESPQKCTDCLTTWVDGEERHVHARCVKGAGVLATFKKRRWKECWNNTYSVCLKATRNHARQILYRMQGIPDGAQLIASGGLYIIIDNTIGFLDWKNALRKQTKADAVCLSNIQKFNVSGCFALAWSQAVLEATFGNFESTVVLQTTPFPLGAVLHALNSKKATGQGVIGFSYIILAVCCTFLVFIMILFFIVLLIILKRKR